ncbi:unnamed protein product, partial [Mesorhabditis belari]|uniref:LIM zinc-binding domain-containing protein n=1 Tax=Mesorhabditis belari TaxID=2138241 RepID=A0AAF3J6F5_9BILA
MSYLSPLPHYPAPRAPSFLAPSRRPPANLHRRNNNPAPPSSAKTRPSLDAATLQHAAASLRKTVDGEQIRSHQEDLSYGSLAGSNQQLPGRDWPIGAQQQPLGANQSVQQVYATPSRSMPTRPLVDLRGRGDPINVPQYPNASPYKNYNAPTVTIQPPTETSIYSSSQYSIPQRSSPSPNYSQQQQYSQPSPTRNFSQTVTRTSYSTVDSPSNVQPPNYIVTPNNNYIQEKSYNTYANVSPKQAAYGNGNYSTPRSSSPLILDARERIHDFATTTAAEVPSTSKFTQARRSPQPARSVDPGSNLAKQIRDQGLTDRQKYANQFQKSTASRDNDLPFSATALYQQSYRNDEVDALVQRMSHGMHTATNYRTMINICSVCNEEVTNERPGCTAMERIYHVACFKCKKCGNQLAGSSFYNVDNEALCEADYQASLERCTKCGQSIADRLLRACGGTFHTSCFTCSVCDVCLDGVPFTVDPENHVHCVPCYHQRYAPRCAVCTAPIVPREGEKESVRVVAMEKSFHPECYRCEDCGLQLSSKIEGQGCYPIDQHLLCRTCNSNRLRLLSST